MARQILYADLYLYILTILLLNTTCPVLANSVDPDQLASSEAKWSGSGLFVIKYVNFYEKPGSSNLIGWKLEVGVKIGHLFGCVNHCINCIDQGQWQLIAGDSPTDSLMLTVTFTRLIEFEGNIYFWIDLFKWNIH